MPLFTFTHFRILLLLTTLAFVALYSAHQKSASRSWEKPLEVVVYPINGDNTQATADYLQSLKDSDLEPVNIWLGRQAAAYSLGIENPARFHFGNSIDNRPPALESQSNPLAVIWWGLKMRWWAFRNTPDSESNLERVRMFVIYQQGSKNKSLPHSLGLEKGLIAVVYAYANKKQTKQNNIVIAHEFLHTVGATDKYDMNNAALYPEGYAEPDRKPLYPQRKAEIMSGHIPIGVKQSHMAASLDSVVINRYTAREINWSYD